MFRPKRKKTLILNNLQKGCKEKRFVTPVVPQFWWGNVRYDLCLGHSSKIGKASVSTHHFRTNNLMDYLQADWILVIEHKALDFNSGMKYTIDMGEVKSMFTKAVRWKDISISRVFKSQGNYLMQDIPNILPEYQQIIREVERGIYE